MSDLMLNKQPVSVDTILDNKEPRSFYNPDLCSRETLLREDDGDFDAGRLNSSLCTLEHLLAGTTLTTCEIRIVICLGIYGGLTHLDLQNLTGMKQSAVSRSISRLTKKKLVYSRIGKKYEVGRPYQYVALTFPVEDLVSLMRDQLESYKSCMDYVESLRKGKDVGDGLHAGRAGRAEAEVDGHGFDRSWIWHPSLFLTQCKAATEPQMNTLLALVHPDRRSVKKKG